MEEEEEFESTKLNAVEIDGLVSVLLLAFSCHPTLPSCAAVAAPQYYCCGVWDCEGFPHRDLARMGSMLPRSTLSSLTAALPLLRRPC